jgi:hypothetical protein
MLEGKAEPYVECFREREKKIAFLQISTRAPKKMEDRENNFGFGISLFLF